LVFPFRDASYDHFGILIVDGVTFEADKPREGVTLRNLDGDWGAAMTAKFHEKLVRSRSLSDISRSTAIALDLARFSDPYSLIRNHVQIEPTLTGKYLTHSLAP